MTTPRDAFTKQCYEAITYLRQDIDAGIYRPVADAKAVDRLLRAWEKSHQERAAYASRGVPAPQVPGRKPSGPRTPQEAAARIRECPDCAQRAEAARPIIEALKKVKAATG